MFLRRNIAISLVSLASVAAMAAPPRQSRFTYTQPDGSQIEVCVSGSDRQTIYRTPDGYPLIRHNDGTYYYATLDNDGKPTRTDIAVSSSPAPAFINAKSTLSAMEKTLQIENPVSAALPSRAGTVFPSSGEVRSIVVLVNYTDVKFSVNSDPRLYIDRMLNEVGFSDNGSTGSAADYFHDNSGGIFQPVFDVYGPIELDHPQKYYGAPKGSAVDTAAELMAIEACRKLDDEIDFSKYDYDKDGCIDNVFVFYAGAGEAGFGGDANCVWPHSYDIDYLGSKYPARNRTFDGVRLNHYACSNEWIVNPDGTNKRHDGIGTFVHEFSHVLGHPDLYNTSGQTTYETPIDWSVLDVGCYLNDSRTPAGYSLYERYALGWAEPEHITESRSVTLEALSKGGSGLIFPTEKENEYYLAECRDKSGWDAYLPYRGMLIWHIDYLAYAWAYNTVNNDAEHQRVDLVRADNSRAWNQTGSRNDAFPGTTNRYRSFTPETKPAFVTWAGDPMPYEITNIKRASASQGSTITFDLAYSGTTGIESVTSADRTLVVRTDGTTLSIVSASTTPYDVFDYTGRKVASASSDEPVVLPGRGIYIVRQDSTTVKVSVR